MERNLAVKCLISCLLSAALLGGLLLACSSDTAKEPPTDGGVADRSVPEDAPRDASTDVQDGEFGPCELCGHELDF